MTKIDPRKIENGRLRRVIKKHLHSFIKAKKEGGVIGRKL
ncbi:hypothetical protein RV00_GL000986 [Enterococcus devriesei]|uniref:Uncharacterized protein n=1 Tax=Enterococcus devriesei TaxID=319970 RepID=A0A1L8SPP1_9ENTE|nr:hypothetical protein RV00_GL000986 [Enterococcus devriesei]